MMKSPISLTEECLGLLCGWRQQIRQMQKAINRKNRIINRLRNDNPHYRKWCYLYGTDPRVNPWIKNTGLFPAKMPPFAKIDIQWSDGTVASGLSAANQQWAELEGLRPYIVYWRFHNSKEK